MCAAFDDLGTQLLHGNGVFGHRGGDGSGFTVVQSIQGGDGDDHGSTVTAYDPTGHALATIPPGSFSGECGAADIAPDGRRLVVTALVTTAPAEGVNPARYSAAMTAWDARTGVKVWTTELVPPQTVDLNSACTAYDGHLLRPTAGPPMIDITVDGRWAVLHAFPGSTEVDGVLDLSTGRFEPRPDVLGVLGNYVVSGKDQGDNPKQTATVSRPPDRSALGAFTLVSSIYDPGVLTSFPWGSSTGVFTVVSAGSSPTTGTSDDGRELFTYETRPSADGYGYLLKAYRLPDMSALWTHTPPSGVDVQLVAEAGGVLVVRSVANAETTIQGLDAATGEQKWSLPMFDVCGLTGRQLLASANGQLAVIDLADGKQLSHVDNGTGGCPVILEGGVQLDGQGRGLTQALVP